MKKLIFSLLILFSFAAAAQLPFSNRIFLPTYWDRITIGGTMGIPQDTFPVLGLDRNYPHIAGKGDVIWIWSPVNLKWVLSSSGSAGASLVGVYNVAYLRANDYQNIPFSPGTRIAGNEPQIINLLGYYANGDGGGGLFYFDLSSSAADNGGTVFKPSSIPGGSPGRWIRIFSGPLNVRWFGMKGDGTTDDRAAWTAAYAAGNDFFSPGGTFRFSDSIVVSKKITLKGVWMESDFHFDANKKGIIFMLPAQFSTVQDMMITSASTAFTDSATHAIISRGHVHINHCYIYGFPGDGINLEAELNVTGYFYGNTSNSKIENNTIFFNGGHGIHARGADASKITGSDNDIRGNGRAAIWDDGFLGSKWDGNMAHSQTARQNNRSVVHKISGSDTTYYVAIRSNTGIEPGINPLWPIYWYVMPTVEFPIYTYLWAVGTSYLSAGTYVAFNPNSRSSFINCYSEGNQPPNMLRGYSLAIAGDQAAGWSTSFAPYLRGNEDGSGGFFSEAPFISHSIRGHTSQIGGEYGLGIKGDNNGQWFEISYDSVNKVYMGQYAHSSDFNTFKVSTFSTHPSMLGRDSAFSGVNGADVGKIMLDKYFIKSSSIYSEMSAGTTPPLTGYHNVGDFRHYVGGADTTVLGFLCIVKGLPGTWATIRTGNWAKANAANISNADLAFTGNRYHNAADYDLHINNLGATTLRAGNLGVINMVGSNGIDSGQLYVAKNVLGGTITKLNGTGSTVSHSFQLGAFSDMGGAISSVGYHNQNLHTWDSLHMNFRHSRVVGGVVAESFLNITADSITQRAARFFRRDMPVIYPDSAYKAVVRDPLTGEEKMFSWWGSLKIINSGTSGIGLLYPGTTGDTLFGKKIVAGTNVTLTQNPDSSVAINGSFSVSRTCDTYLDSLSSQTLLNGTDSVRYYGYPSVSRAPNGDLLLTFYRGFSHTDSGVVIMKRSTDHGLTWGPDSIIRATAADNWRALFSEPLRGDTILLTTWKSGHSPVEGSIYWAYSLDNGRTSTAWTRISSTDSQATESNPRIFKEKWVIPFYSFTPSTNQNGVLYSTTQGSTWTKVYLPNSATLQLSEAGLVATPDTLFIFSRCETNPDTIYMHWTTDAVTWSSGEVVRVPQAWTGRPAVHRMFDGRILLHNRSRENPNVDLDNNKVYISNNNGRDFTILKSQVNPNNFIEEHGMYGAFVYIGGERYLNVAASVVFASAPERSSIYQYNYRIPSCEVLVNNVEVEKLGDPFFNTGGTSGGITGTLATGRIPFATGVSTVTTSSKFLYDSVNIRLGVDPFGGGGPTYTFDMSGTFNFNGGDATKFFRFTPPALLNLSGANPKFVLGRPEVHADYGLGFEWAYLSGKAKINAPYDGSIYYPISIALAGGTVGIGNDAPGAKLDITGDLKIGTIANETTDVDKFLVSNAGIVKYRTGAEVLSDIGVSYGVYTSTLTNTTNVAASTAYEGQWSQVGNVVTYSGKVDIDPTAAAATELQLTIPVASGFTNAQECGGAAVSYEVAGLSASVSAVPGGGTKIAIKFVAVDLANRSFHFTCTYKVTPP